MLDITNLATNTSLNAKNKWIKKEITSITYLTTTNDHNDKINDFKNKIPNITNLATTTRTAVENIIPSSSNLVKKKLTITQKLVKLKWI